MKILNNYAMRCMQMLNDIGIIYGNVREFTVNTRATSRWGQCRFRNGYYSINISEYLLRDDTDEVGLIQTLLNELLHTCNGCMNHGKEWQRLANKVNRAYGYAIKRTSSEEDVGLSAEATLALERVCKAKAPKATYIIRCTHCGQEYIRHKMSKTIEHPEWYSCGECGHKLIRVQ